jgi:hypothetical protein
MTTLYSSHIHSSVLNNVLVGRQFLVCCLSRRKRQFFLSDMHALMGVAKLSFLVDHEVAE